MKKTGGFTLVELIVVIAILAILAAVAVPAYSGYITKANEAKDLTQLDAIKTAAVFAYTEKTVADGGDDTDVNSIKVTTSAVYVNGTDADDEVNVYGVYTEEFAPSSDKFATGATWDGDTWEGIEGNG
ncbi:MAG: prepilin-type N-terminal cleavage/methylation domain-containing protein [Oscillospiraceae bacterium]|nr:prepilin-type N-terminal cleavage/methylation domain-containing protein [Oscillospiraceae bacterium]